MGINDYLKQILDIKLTGIATEHSYRSTLQALVTSINDKVGVTNEPRRQLCGAPDLIIHRGDIPLGYIETKDIGTNIENPKGTDLEQRKRYIDSLDNIIFTDYLRFIFYRSGCITADIKLATPENRRLIYNRESFANFESQIRDFCDYSGQTIKTADALALIMARKANLMKSVIYKALSDKDVSNTLYEQYLAFKKILIHDLELDTFSDLYAQTITYGLFIARINDNTRDTFSRQEARELVPKSNPFLRSLFDYFSGAQLDDRITWIVDDLADVMRSADFRTILEDYNKVLGVADPFIHFYETFLAQYNPSQRKLKGVYYTPNPIVKFIVKSVDEILRTTFSISKGLANREMLSIRLPDKEKPDKRSSTGYKTIEYKIPRIQILDPAVGTGTFLCEIIKLVHEKYQGQEGLWPEFVNSNMLPKLNGFELLVAPYTICHLRIGMLLDETGLDKSSITNRIRVYLTNSLEKPDPDTESLLAAWLSDEANEANKVKNSTPIMVVIGNPPYSISSANRNDWIRSIIADYKKDLNETKLNLDDDYIKFIRCAQYYLDKVPEGVLAFITNNSYIDGLTHRQMRKHLLSSFNKVYILDLHGNVNKKEKAPSGGRDENVFDIKQGVAISLFIKTNSPVREILHYDLFGTRDEKYGFLMNHDLGSISWEAIAPDDEYCFFNSRRSEDSQYMKFISMTDILPLYNSGIQTKCDRINIHFSEDKACEVVEDFSMLKREQLIEKYAFLEKSKVWSIDEAITDIRNHKPLVFKEQYRPFDFRYAIYTGKKGIVARPRSIVSNHLIGKDNIALCMMRQVFQDVSFSHVLATKHMVDERTMYSNRGGTYIFPLFKYEIINGQETRVSNIPENIAEKFVQYETSPKERSVSRNSDLFSQKILNYCYAIMYAPYYRNRFRSFLTYDFPRIPLPTNKILFDRLAELGESLVNLHTFVETNDLAPITTFNVIGSMSVSKVERINDSVYINERQFFGNVPDAVWNYYIGGYQPVKLWLKERKGMTLSSGDVNHYQSMIAMIAKTIEVTNEINVNFLRLIDDLG